MRFLLTDRLNHFMCAMVQQESQRFHYRRGRISEKDVREFRKTYNISGFM